MLCFQASTCCVLAVWVTALVVSSASALPSFDLNERIERIIRSEDVDGYDIATVFAVDPNSHSETRQTKRDLQAHASDPASAKRLFSLQLASGQQLRMSLDRRSVDTSGARFTALTEEGEREITLQDRDCCFSGPLDGKQEGFATLSMCGGKLRGGISTSKRDYEIHPLPQTVSKREAADDVTRVLVTWQETASQKRDLDDLFDFVDDEVWDIPEDDDDDEEDDVDDGSEKKRRSLEDRSATIEIGDFVDRFFIEDLDRKLGLTTDEEVIQFIINKWTGVASILVSQSHNIDWNITLHLVSVILMRKDPDFYQTEVPETMGARMKKICLGTQNMTLDQVTLHTGQTSNVGVGGLAYTRGLCSSKRRCIASKASKTNFMAELHELGHNVGLHHDPKVEPCLNTTEPNGFMGGNRDYFRFCYKAIFDRKFTGKSGWCVFSNFHSNDFKEFN